MSILFTCLVYSSSVKYSVLTTPLLPEYIGTTPLTFILYFPVLILFIKLFSECDPQLLPNSSRKTNFSRFLATFIITPNTNQTQNPVKFSLICFFTKLKSNVLIIGSRLFVKIFNMIRVVKLPKYLLWRPLFKKSSYYGLFVHARTNFLKIFK